MDPIGLEIRNLLRVEQAANGLVGESRQLLAALFEDIAAEIARIDPTGASRTRYRQERLQRLFSEVERLTGRSFRDIRKLLVDRLSEMGTIQAETASRTLQRVVAQGSPSTAAAAVVARIGGRGVVGPDLFRAILQADPFGEPGKGVDVLQGWIQSAERSTLTAFRRRIQAGMVQEDTLDAIVRRVRGEFTGRYRSVRLASGKVRRIGIYSGGVQGVASQHVEAITRTGVNFIANRGYQETFQRNADVVGGLRYTATLDGRTTPTCRARDGRVWALDDPDRPQLPAHYQCRSVYTAVVDWAGLGLEPPEGGTRASEDGQVDAGLSYEDWLRRAPAAKQDRVLGAARGRLFRDGVTLSQMVREDGTEITLDELRGAA